MSGEYPDEGRFLLSWPAFTLGDETVPDQTPAQCFVTPGTPEHGLFFPLFSDADLASSAIEAVGKLGVFFVMEIRSPLGLYGFLELAGRRGAKYVGVDVDFRPGQTRGMFIPIGEVQSAVRELIPPEDRID